MAGKDVSVGIGADNSELLRVLNESKSAVTEFFTTVTEEGAGLGSMLEDIQGKFSAAFNFAGVTIGIEAIKQIGETIERMGQQAAQLRTVSDVLGVTTDQLQAMQEAAEHAGVGQDTLVHASEHLVSILTEARNGSSSAADKLFALGVTADQINDPTFKLVDLLGLLHDRLTDTATSADTMNELIVVLGSRAALAAEAIKKFDGSEESVAEVMKAINALSGEQNKQLTVMGISWDEFSTKVENSTKKAILSMAGMAEWLKSHNSTLAALANGMGAPTLASKQSGAFDSVAMATQQAEELINLAKKTAQEQASLDQKMALQGLENIKAGVAAYQEGSAQKLAALQNEYNVAQKVYGNDTNDKAVAINQQLIAEQRAYAAAQIQLAKEVERADDVSAASHLANIKSMIDENGRYIAGLQQSAAQQKQIDDGIRSMEETGLELQTEIYKQRAAASAQLTKLNAKATQDQLQQWQFLTNGMRNGLQSALQGMLTGTMSFGQAMRSMFTSVLDGIIGKIAEWAAEWVTKLLITEVANKTTAVSAVAANSAMAATAAMASVAAIPFVGWAMAPEVGATTYAEGMAYMASAAAEDGFDVPAGQNPVTQLHQREMVLPAPLAEGVRNMTNQGSAPQQPGSAAARRNVHLHAKQASGDHVLVTRGNLADMIRELGHSFKLA